MTTRRINTVDRMLSHEDGMKRVIGETVKAHRRTVLRFGQLEVVVVEEPGEQTKVYLSNDDDSITEATAAELASAAAAVRVLLANPLPIKRRRT